MVTADWQGGTIEFDIWPPVRPTAAALLQWIREPNTGVIFGVTTEEVLQPQDNPNHLHVKVTAPVKLLKTGGWNDVTEPNLTRRLAARYHLWWLAPPPGPVTLSIAVSGIQDSLSGTPAQLALVHTYPRVTIGDATYLTALDLAGLTFKKVVAPQDQIPIHIEVWRNVDHVIVKGTAKLEQGKWFVYLPDGQKFPLPDNFDSLPTATKTNFDSLPTATKTQLTTFAEPAPPNTTVGKVRSLTLNYSLSLHSISGDAAGNMGTKIHVPNDGPNSVGFDFTINDK